MHSVQKRDTARSSVEQRLSSINEPLPIQTVIQAYDYQGDKIKEVARGGWNRDGPGADELNPDPEKGIVKTMSLEVTRDSKTQG